MASPFTSMPPVRQPTGGVTSTLPWLGAGLAAAGSIYGAYNQNQTNAANLAAQQAQFAKLAQMIQGQMQTGPNPYAQQLMSLFQGGGQPQQMQPTNPMMVNQGQLQQGLPFGSGQPGGFGGQQLGDMVFSDPSMLGGGGGGPLGIPRGGPMAPGIQAAAQARQQMQGQQQQQGGGMALQQWTPFQTGQYDPTQAARQKLGAAPGVSTPNALSYLTVNSPGRADQVNANGMNQVADIVAPPGVSAQQLGTDFGAQQIGANFGAQQIGLPNQIDVPLINAPQFGSQFNSGQDSLMQMMRRGPQQARDRALQSNLQQMYNPGAYDVSGIINAQNTLQQQGLDQQVSALRGSARSLGQRLGGAMGRNEALLRSQVLNQGNLNTQNLLQSSYNQSQANRLQALGLGQQGLAQQNQFNLGAGGLQQQAAQTLQQGGFQQAQLGQQAQAQNAANVLQAQGIDVNAYLQAMQANQGAGLQANSQNLQAMQANQGAGLQAQGQSLQAMLANQSMGMQGQQFNAQQMMQAALANQQTQFGTGQFNAQQAMQAALANQQGQQFSMGQNLQAQLANQSAGMQTGQFNNQQALQAALANQSMQGQYGMQQGNMDLQTALANAQAMNQGSQFNIGQQFNAAGLNAQQGNIYNQNLLSSLGQANSMQQGQNQYNLGLMGLLAGQQIPQQQYSATPGAVGDISQLMMLLPYLTRQG